MICQNNIRILSSKPFILGALFFCFLSGETFSQKEDGNVYNYVQQKATLKKTEIIQGENSENNKNRFIGYDNELIQKSSQSKEILFQEKKADGVKNNTANEETSTLSLNIFLYVLDTFKED
ncbi:hypothetical protein Q4534_11230 [Cyclobacterium sp. 1_MG-2023]|uniref:hypothetical protein n=1 Tax=Cyclobacterium sp. 1_MG-2023 TaxID=3062681 RepID=UPI0026E45EB0|nr:hypothetical protein [Cyclobacterium sp. 1_MG-2023]MDO6437986.1 hypothetical protein [Cyclobacterium sp. 1_MG-2023]